MQTTSAEILLKGIREGASGQITAVVTDSRRVQPGCLFLCFEGARADGHDFAAAAIQQGAAYIVGRHAVEGVPEEQMIVVPDVSHAMVTIAGNYRALFQPKLIGVTGSVGKTTTKEFCAAVLESFGNTLKTEGNQNNEIGMPNTLLRMDENTRYGVVEMGMSHLGEISRLVHAARPNAGIITCIGVSHLENLGSRENILKAKLELCEGLPEGAPLVLNYDDDLLRNASLPAHVKPVWVSLEDGEADVCATGIHSGAEGESFVIEDMEYGSLAANIPVIGRHNIRDALAAYTAATRLGLAPAQAARALSGYQTTGLRQHMIHRNGLTVMEDCYNASPDSMKASIETFMKVPGKRHLALLGDMLELGSISEQAHRDLGAQVAQAGMDYLFTYGTASWRTAVVAAGKGVKTLHFENQAEAAEALFTRLESGDALLVKGSRGMKLEKIIEMLFEYQEQNGQL